MEHQALLADLIRELEAADLIIRQLDALRKEAHQERAFTLRTGARGQLLIAAKGVA